MSKAIVVLSGGLDSTTALYKALQENDEVHAVSLNYGQKQKIELEYAAKTCAKLGVRHDVLDASTLGLVLESALTSDIDVPEGHYEADNMKTTVVPNRNSILLNIVAGIAISRGATRLYTGIHAGDHHIYPDCRPEFVDALQELLRVANYERVTVEAPFMRSRKEDIVSIGAELGEDFSLTYSCYKGGEKHCGKCGTCVERIEAFNLAGVTDPTQYENM